MSYLLTVGSNGGVLTLYRDAVGIFYSPSEQSEEFIQVNSHYSYVCYKTGKKKQRYLINI